jgi:hypothetical protein
MQSRVRSQLLYKIEYLRTAAPGDPRAAAPREPQPMAPHNAQKVFIQGVTKDGRVFRPSDWAERLAGVMSSFRPGGARPGSHLSYSPWVVPTVIEGVKCVIVNRELRSHDAMAWDFVINFARDNDLHVSEGAFVPPAKTNSR